MSKLTKQKDAFGKEIYDHYRGVHAEEIPERNDGWIGASGGPQAYFTEYSDWPATQKKAIKFAHGRVLDIGCGAGRVALHLQNKGLDVLGIDNSPLAIKTCKLRGIKKARVMSITEVTPKLGVFDAIVMYGNNFGLFGSFERARWLLRRLRNMTSPTARIIASTMDPYDTAESGHKRYQSANKRRGRMGGQLKIRIRYKDYATPWFDYLLASRDEVRQIVAGTGWTVARFIEPKGARYIAVLEKENSS